MTNCIKASETQNSRKKPKKTRRPLTLQALRDKKRPTAWLRSLISPLDFGLKVRKVGPAGEPVTRPVHCNTNAEIFDAYKYGDWYRIERLSNPMLDDHWNNRQTFYYTCNGSTRNRFILVNIDIDCHASGSPEGALQVAEYLKANFFPNLYHEPSTNGRGRHGYFIFDKWCLGAETVKRLLKNLERCLNAHLLAKGFDIELCEIKGLPPVILWGDDDRISNFTAGILAKIPRQVERFEEWKQTTLLNEFTLNKLISTLRTLTPTAPSAKKVVPEIESKSSKQKPSGSIGGKLIGDEELAQLDEGGHYRTVATTLMESHVMKTSGRSVVIPEDVAVFLMCLKFFSNRMNADGTLPVKRFEGLWTGLYEAGDVGRSFDCHRFKAIRDYLSDLSLIDWEDNSYVVSRIDGTGKRQKGRACKWKAGRKLMEMLNWEQGEEGFDGFEVEEHDAKVVDELVEGGEEGRAPFVGSGHKVTSSENHEERGRGEASFVGTDESPLRPAHDRIKQTIQSLSFVSDDLKIRPVESTGCKPWHLLPDEVTLLIPDIEESMRLLAA